MKLSGYLIAGDGHKVYYDHYKSNHKKVIIIAHGFFSSKQSVLLKKLAVWLNDEYDCIVFDFRGHGQSKGLFYWTSKEYLDLLAVTEFSGQHYKKIGLIGFSLGAATSIITASKTILINSIIAISAPIEFGKIDYRFWNLDVKNDILYSFFDDGKYGKGVRPGPFWHKKEKPVDIVKKLEIPIFYIHGETDTTIHNYHSKELYQQTASIKKRVSIIKDGPHAEYLFRENKDEILRLIYDWFHETLK